MLLEEGIMEVGIRGFISIARKTVNTLKLVHREYQVKLEHI